MAPRRRGPRPRRGPNPDPEPSRKPKATPDDSASFPAPEGPPDEKVTPLFADQRAVVLSQVERQVTRDALNYYLKTLDKKAKALRELGLPTDDLVRRVALINGGNGLGSGIYSKLTEQMSIGDAAQLRLDDERRAVEAEAVACRDALRGLPMMPGGSYDEELLAHVKRWEHEKRESAIAYATAIEALPEQEQQEFEGKMPAHVRSVVERAIEWVLTPEEIEQWASLGPWRVSWWKDGSDVTWYYAERPGPVEGEKVDPKLGDEGLFDTETAARRCVARLNRIAAQTSEG